MTYNHVKVKDISDMSVEDIINNYKYITITKGGELLEILKQGQVKDIDKKEAYKVGYKVARIEVR